MTETSAQQYDPRAVRRGRLFALALFAIAALPIALASAMYYGGWGATGGVANNGELLQPVAGIAEFGFTDQQGAALVEHFKPAVEEARWMLLTVAEDCGEPCRAAIYETRQVHIALGKESNRVQRAIWAPALTAAQLEEYPGLVRLQLAPDTILPKTLPGGAKPTDGYQIYVVDPNGNVVLRFDQGNSGEDLLDDLKRLLKLSNIG